MRTVTQINAIFRSTDQMLCLEDVEFCRQFLGMYSSITISAVVTVSVLRFRSYFASKTPFYASVFTYSLGQDERKWIAKQIAKGRCPSLTETRFCYLIGR